jgi:hypothetical protein
MCVVGRGLCHPVKARCARSEFWLIAANLDVWHCSLAQPSASDFDDSLTDLYDWRRRFREMNWRRVVIDTTLPGDYPDSQNTGVQEINDRGQLAESFHVLVTRVMVLDSSSPQLQTDAHNQPQPVARKQQSDSCDKQRQGGQQTLVVRCRLKRNRPASTVI